MPFIDGRLLLCPKRQSGLRENNDMDKLHLKRAIKQNPLGAWILGIKESVEEKRLLRRRMPYLPAVKQLVGGAK